MNPGVSNARWQFKLRTLVNIGGVVLAFVAGAILFEAMGIWFIGDLLLIGVLCFVYLKVLDKRAIQFDCPHCRKKIASNTPWICGFCHQTNRQVDDYPFVHRCEHCQAEPKAYLCHHCGSMIFLSEDELKEGYARSVGAPVIDRTEEKRKSQDDQIKDLEFELLSNRLKVKIKSDSERANPPPPKGTREVLLESFEKHTGRTMTAYEIADERRAEAREKYKDNPDMLERALLTIQAWLEDEQNK